MKFSNAEHVAFGIIVDCIIYKTEPQLGYYYNDIKTMASRRAILIALASDYVIVNHMYDAVYHNLTCRMYVLSCSLKGLWAYNLHTDASIREQVGQCIYTFRNRRFKPNDFGISFP